MRKGYMLVEMLAVLAIVAFSSIAFAGLFRTLLRDIPGLNKISQSNTTVLNMLEQMRKDIDLATELTKNGEILIIRQDGKTIKYKIESQEIRRTLDGQAAADYVWSAPKAKIKWNIRRKNGKGYAVEIINSMEYIFEARRLKKLSNSNVFFAGGQR